MSFEGADIDGLLQGAVEAGTWHGVVAVVVDRDGVLYEGAAGQADAQTMFRNASMTKAVATTGALQLVEQGQLELDAPVESLLPEFGELQVIDGYDGERPILRPPSSKPTIRQLMTHTAGLGYFFLNERLLRYFDADRTAEPAGGKKSSLDGPLVNDPGTVWEYGVNTDWLGLVVERVSGQSLDAYLQEHVYGPLGMSDSTFRPTAEQRSRLLPVLMRAPDGESRGHRHRPPDRGGVGRAGHGSYGTAGDYARFIRAWLRDGELDGERILAPDTVALAFSDQIEGIALPEVMKSCMPELSNDVPVAAGAAGLGLGFHLIKVDLPGMRSAGTGAWSGIFNTYYWIDRAAGVGGVIMTQVLPFFDAKIVEAALAFEAAVYAQVGAVVPALAP